MVGKNGDFFIFKKSDQKESILLQWLGHSKYLRVFHFFLSTTYIISNMVLSISKSMFPIKKIHKKIAEDHREDCWWYNW